MTLHCLVLSPCRDPIIRSSAHTPGHSRLAGSFQKVLFHRGACFFTIQNLRTLSRETKRNKAPLLKTGLCTCDDTVRSGWFHVTVGDIIPTYSVFLETKHGEHLAACDLCQSHCFSVGCLVFLWLPMKDCGGFFGGVVSNSEDVRFSPSCWCQS